MEKVSAPKPDHFACLNQPRRPWLEPDTLKATFLKLSAEHHPDRFHEAEPSAKEAAHHRYTEINTAYNCLRDPRQRALHLLELETGRPPVEVQEIPHETTQLFMDVGQLCRGVDQFLKQNEAVTSPVLKARQFQQSQEWVGRIRQLQQTLDEWREELHKGLKNLNPAWDQAGPLPVKRLEQIYRLLSYQSRWSAQLQERFVNLAVL